MKKSAILPFLVLTLAVAGCKSAPEATPTPRAAEPISFDDYFYDKTMRLDFYHCGDSLNEMYFFDELKQEPYFAGSHVSLTDSFNYGTQRFVLVDEASGKEIYSYHYCTLWDEWRCEPEASSVPTGMPESVVFPYPKHNAVAQIWSRLSVTETKKRGLKHQPWEKKFEYPIRTDNPFVRAFSPVYEVQELHVAGATQHCLDIVLLPEGYTENEKDRFLDDCRLFISEFFRFEPWTSNQNRVNIRMVWAPSKESGVSIPSENKWFATNMKIAYDTFNSNRYQMTRDYQAVRDIAGHAPYDYIYVLTNSDKYGGGGIYNFYGIGAGHDRFGSSGAVHVHEFGHQMLGLGDEYVEIGNNISEQYQPGVEPYEANLTTLTDISSKPWAKEKAEPDSIFGESLAEGGGYLEHGVWRPYENCLMRALAYPFCPTCLKAVTDYLEYICR